MITKESQKRRLNLARLIVAMLAAIFAGSALAQEEPFLDEPFMDEELKILPEDLQMPGTIEGTGTYFEVTESEYLNIMLQSSEPVNLRLESVPEMVVMDIEAAKGAASTQITLSGFEPSTTYYKYEGDYHNSVAFTTDGGGSYSYTQDLAIPHHVFIQPQAGTIFLSDSGWSDPTVGTWDESTQTGTLTTDVYETIQIDGDGITLDGNGHLVTGSGTGYGAYLPWGRTGVTIRALNVEVFAVGIYLYNSSNNSLTGNTARGNWRGIFLYNSSNNTVASNTASDNNDGIYLIYSSGNTLAGNTANSNGTYGMYASYSASNTLTSNAMSGNGWNFCVGGDLDSHFDHDVDTSNTVDGKLIYYVRNAVGEVYDSSAIPNVGVLYCINCDSITIKELTLTNNGAAVFLWNTHHSTIEKVLASDNSYAICLANSNSNTLIGNTTNSNNTGIHLYNSSNNTLTGNIGNSNNVIGMQLSRNCSYNTLKGNTASLNGSSGISLHEGCENNTIAANSVLGNNWCGLYAASECNNNTISDNIVSGNDWGILIKDRCSGNIISLNTVSNNTTLGIRLDLSSNNEVYNNNFTDNGYGIYVTYRSNDNEIYNNNFIDNSTQAYVRSDCSGNIFNLPAPTGGNYWSNWCPPLHPDNNNDGFVDEPYEFDYGGVDYLPWARQDGWRVTPVDIDIKPGSYPNSINLGSKGVIPVAILSDTNFDATSVDASTVTLAGAGVAVRGKAEKYMAHEEDVNGDGLLDLVVQVQTENLDPDEFQQGLAVLKGETLYGEAIEGQDEITIVPPAQ